MIRKLNHQLTEGEQYRGQIGSRESAGRSGRVRQEGMFIDVAGFIMGWRNNDGKGYPPIAKLTRFLRERGWTGEQGGELSRTEVSRMLKAMDPTGSAIPSHKAVWDAFKNGSVELPSDIEIVNVGIDPKGWIEMRTAKKEGWKPSWRDRTLSETGEETDAESLRDALARLVIKPPRADE